MSPDSSSSPPPPSRASPRFASAHSLHTDPPTATTRACEQVIRTLGNDRVDLAFVFVAGEHAEHAAQVLKVVRERLAPSHVVGSSAEGLVGGAMEFEGLGGVSIFAASLPNVGIHTFTDRDLPPVPDEPDRGTRDAMAFAIGATSELRATFLFVDTFSVPMVRLLPALNACRSRDADGHPIGAIVGGLASGAKAPGEVRLLLNDTVRRHGIVGVSLSGNVRIDAMVSQGCRPIGPPFVVTKAKGNVILQLGGRAALDAMQSVVVTLPAQDQDRLHDSLLLGRVVNEYKDRFGRSDFLIRNIIGVDADHRAVAVTDIVRTGQTVQLHLRDADTATQDLGLLLDGQRLHEDPLGALLFTCNSRGTRLFASPHHDAAKVSHAFDRTASGEQSAKGGSEIDPSHPVLPLAGFFAAGEIGPVGDECHLHGQSACVVLFRAL